MKDLEDIFRTVDFVQQLNNKLGLNNSITQMLQSQQQW
jgi:hypothetical protein